MNDVEMTTARINEMLKDVKKEDLAKIQTAEDYVKFVQDLQPETPISEDIKNILRSEFDRIKKESAGESEKSFYGKLILGIAGGAATAYFGGPIAAVAARAIYTAVWGMFFGGVPAIYSPSYLLVFMPGREHIAYAAYQVGPWFMSTVAAPAVYAAASGLESAAGWLGSRTLGYFNRKAEATVASKEEINPPVDDNGFVLLPRPAITPSLNMVRSKSVDSLKELAEKEPVTTYRALTL